MRKLSKPNSLTAKYRVNMSLNRNNNFDFLRFFAATLVIFSHSFILSTNTYSQEPFAIFSNNQESFGGIGVAIFFIISGYLITLSYDRSKNIIFFLKSRILRIFPAFVLVLLFTVFVLGPLVTSLPINNYFQNKQTYKYLLSISMYILHPIEYYQLPGVFTNNIYPGINGSLWTLKYELFFYIFVAILGLIGMLKKQSLLILVILFFIMSYLNMISWGYGEKLLKYFSIGAFFYIFREHIPFNKNIALTSILILELSLLNNSFLQLFPIFGGYLVIYFAFSPKINLNWFSKLGDFSYGLYIFAFPIQQTIIFSQGGKMNPLQNFIFSFPLILICAFLSWHLIEKHALKIKNKRLLQYLLYKLNGSLTKLNHNIKNSNNI